MSTSIENKFADLQPIAVSNAVLLLRQANDKVLHAKGVKAQYEDLSVRAQEALDAATDALKRAEYVLKISALQPNGGEQ